MISYGRQSISSADVRAVSRALQSDFLTQGPEVAAFESAIAKYTKTKYAVAVGNGTEALHLAYLAAGLGPGDEVITTPNTFVATSNMLLAVGATPVFCDIRLDTYNIDESKIEALITPRTKAIVPVHVGGQPCAMDKILAIARKHQLFVIEDACHALGARHGRTRIGPLGDLSVLSFHAIKPITTGEGGMILTNNEKMYKKMLLLRSHGITKDANGFNVMTELGYNYRLTDFQCALGLSQLARLDAFLKKRHEIAEWYARELGDLSSIILPVELNGLYSGWYLYVIRVRDARQRLGLYNHLRARGVGVNLNYPCVYAHPYYQQHGFSAVHCPNAEAYVASAITLPMHPSLTRRDVRFVANQIKTFYEKIREE